MLARDLAKLLMRIAGLVLIVTALASLPAALGRIMANGTSESITNALVLASTPATPGLIVGLLLYWCGGMIVDRAVLRSTLPESGIDLREIEEIAVAVLGVYLFFLGVSETAYYVAEWRLIMAEPHAFIPPRTVAGLISSVLRTVIGVGVMLFSRGVVALRRRLLSLRDAGRGD